MNGDTSKSDTMDNDATNTTNREILRIAMPDSHPGPKGEVRE